jgi:hypothetical protein
MYFYVVFKTSTARKSLAVNPTTIISQLLKSMHHPLTGIG